MEVEVTMESEIQDVDTIVRTGAAFVTMVAFDQNDKPIIVPRLDLKTDEEKNAFARAR